MFSGGGGYLEEETKDGVLLIDSSAMHSEVVEEIEESEEVDDGGDNDDVSSKRNNNVDGDGLVSNSDMDDDSGSRSANAEFSESSSVDSGEVVEEQAERISEVSEGETEKQADKGAQVSEVIKYEAPTEVYEVSQTFEATAYTAYCEGCSGITYSGVDVRNTEHFEGKRVIAVDPDVIPIGSDVQVTLDDGRSFEGTAQDIGGAIKGRKIDILVSNRDKALDFGRQGVEVRILK